MWQRWIRFPVVDGAATKVGGDRICFEFSHENHVIGAVAEPTGRLGMDGDGQGRAGKTTEVSRRDGEETGRAYLEWRTGDGPCFRVQNESCRQIRFDRELLDGTAIDGGPRDLDRDALEKQEILFRVGDGKGRLEGVAAVVAAASEGGAENDDENKFERVRE